MDIYSLTNNKILDELGSRVKTLRLRKNITQEELADKCALSLNSIKSLEKGRAKIITLVIVLRELGELEKINNFVPKPPISPLQLAKLKGKTRKRASKPRSSD